MATYVMLTTLTNDGRRTLRECPERIKDVNIEVEDMGASIVSQYALIGPYDFINVLDAPDNETIVRISMELGARGTVQCMTMAAISIDDFVQTLGKESVTDGAAKYASERP